MGLRRLVKQRALHRRSTRSRVGRGRLSRSARRWAWSRLYLTGSARADHGVRGTGAGGGLKAAKGPLRNGSRSAGTAVARRSRRSHARATPLAAADLGRRVGNGICATQGDRGKADNSRAGQPRCGNQLLRGPGRPAGLHWRDENQLRAVLAQRLDSATCHRRTPRDSLVNCSSRVNAPASACSLAARRNAEARSHVLCLPQGAPLQALRSAASLQPLWLQGHSEGEQVGEAA